MNTTALALFAVAAIAAAFTLRSIYRRNRSPFMDGADANMFGLPLSANPHRSSDPAFGEWVEGWLHEQACRASQPVFGPHE